MPPIRTVDGSVTRRKSCGGCGKCNRCNRVRGPTGPTGSTGATGPTGQSAGVGCCQVGLGFFNAGGTSPYVITEAMLHNPSYGAGVRYREIVVSNTPSDGEVTIPTPSGYDTVYQLVVENQSAGPFTLKNAGAAVFVLPAKGATERSLEQEIVDGAVSIASYRTDVSSRPNGVWRVPGFAGI